MLCLATMAAGGSLQAAELKIPFEKYQLGNGLRVVLSKDSSAPVVAVYLVYGVGARSEEKGRSGFAHLFEHMMFQGSENAPKGMHFQTVEANGGWLNGSTHADYTDYYEVLPSNKLPVALWLEADRMRGLAITEENLANQKEAVKEERRLRLDNQPYVTAIVDEWPQLAFNNWSNSHSFIGSFEDLNAAGVEDVARFFRTYYAPNNAILCIVGDIGIPATKKLIETYFGDIEAQEQPKRPDLAEVTQTEGRRKVYNDALARLPAVIIGYQGPKRRSPDYYALMMLDLILTGGDSSRFQQRLVKGKESVIQYEASLGWPFADHKDYRDPGVYAFNVIHKPNFTGDEIVEQVTAEIAEIQEKGVGKAELQRARAFLRSHTYRQLQSALSRATRLAQYEYLDGDPSLINTELEEYVKVTPEQIQAVAKKYFQPGRRSVLVIAPAPPKEGESK